MRALVSLVSRCCRLARRTPSLAAQLQYHTSQSALSSTSALAPFQLLSHTSSQSPPPLYAVVGLGNPGPLFADTRHNVGAMCLQHIATAYSLLFDAYKPIHLCQLAQCIRPLPLTPTRTDPPGSPPPHSPPRHLLLALPTTYMNQSGRALLSLMSAYHVPPHHVIILYDDVHLPLGTLRIATRGTPGGHNGLADILDALKAANRRQSVVRLRVGVGKDGLNESGGLAAYVLGRFTHEEMAVLEGEVYAKVRRAVEGIAAGEVERMMNAYNGKQSRNTNDKMEGGQTRRVKERQTRDDCERAAVT